MANNINLNTETINSNIATLNDRKGYYNGKTSIFYKNAFNSSKCPRLTNFLGKINGNYVAIGNNIENVKNYLNNYKSDVEALENLFCGGTGTINSSSTASKVSTYKNSITTYSMPEEMPFAIEKVFEVNIPPLVVEDLTLKLVETTSADTQSALQDNNSHYDDLLDWWSTSAWPWICQAAGDVWDVLQSIGASLITFVISILEAVFKFAEELLDFVAIVITAVMEGATYVAEFGSALFGQDLDLSDYRTKLWEDTRAAVSEEHVTNYFNSFYENDPLGKWLKEEAYFFDTVRSVGNGLGHIAAVVAFTIITFGAGGATSLNLAFVSAAAGMGKGTEKAWNEGASTESGLLYGLLSGAWDGFQFYLGSKVINGFGKGIPGQSGLWGKGFGYNHKAINTLARILFDTMDGASEGFVQPLLTGIYADGYYNEQGEYIKFTENDSFAFRYSKLFEANGGWQAVWTGAAASCIGSTIGELFDIARFFKDKKAKGDVDIDTAEPRVRATDGTDVDVSTGSSIPKISKSFLEMSPEELAELTEAQIKALNPLDPEYAAKVALLEQQEQMIMQLKREISGIDLSDSGPSAIELLTADQQAQVKAAAQKIYDNALLNESEISNLMKSLEGTDAHLEGFDYRVKALDHLEDKIARSSSGGVYSIQSCADGINDSLRYTLVVDDSSYSDIVIEKLADLKKAGYEVYGMNNSWGNFGSPTYQGLNVTLQAPNGTLFELQFHTEASFNLKQTINHDFYEISRNPAVSQNIRNLSNTIQSNYQQLYVADVGFDITNPMALAQRVQDYLDAIALAPKVAGPGKAYNQPGSDYMDFMHENKANLDSWDDACQQSPNLKKTLGEYKGESNTASGSYKIANAHLRGTLFDDANQIVTITGTGGSKLTYTYKQFELELEYAYGKPVSIAEYKGMVDDSIKTLSDGISQCHLSQDTQLIRGVNWDTLKYQFGIDDTDTLDVITQKLQANGGVWNEAGFMSACPRVADADLPWIVQNKPIKLVMDVEAGVDAKIFGTLSYGDYEKEILLNYGQSFQITKAEWIGSELYIYMSHIIK